MVRQGTLLVVSPELAEEWHPTKNGRLSPADVPAGNDQKIWWQCRKVSEHQWEASIKDRKSGTGCPYCAGKRVCSQNSLVALFPEVAKEWHVINNKDLTPDSVTAGSGKKVWWQCSKCSHHQWQASVYDRTKGRGCPYCARIRVCRENALTTIFPELAKEWHPTKNEKVTPDEVAAFSGKKAWWQCSESPMHEWQATIANRAKGRGCPYCAGTRVCADNSLLTLLPQTAKEWHPTKNRKLTPVDVTKGSKKIVWWQCSKFSSHEWRAAIYSRAQGSGCPLCSNQTSRQELRILSELRSLFSDVKWRSKIRGKEIDVFLPRFRLGVEYDGRFYHEGKEEKDRKKSGDLELLGIRLLRLRERPLAKLSPYDVEVEKAGLTKKNMDDILLNMIQCGAIHDEASIDSIEGYVQRNQFLNEDLYSEMLSNISLPEYQKTLDFIFPEIAREWHPTRNKSLTPSAVTGKSGLKVWWQCSKVLHHEWEANIWSRTRGRGCPYCAGQSVCREKSLASLLPELAKEWHPTKNGERTPGDVTGGSGKKVWWRCSKSQHHEWEASVSSRKRGRGCPFCAGARVCSENSLAFLFPKVAKEWHPKRNEDQTPEHVTAGSRKKVWWQCPKVPHHEWEATVVRRTRGAGCPYCAGRRVYPGS